MTTILTETKLDYDDVLLVPKRSEISSRKEVNLYRRFKFKHSSRELNCVPIIAANMENIGTKKVASILQSYGLLTALTKHNSNTSYARYNDVFITVGMENNPMYFNSSMICIDVANGYTKKFADYITKIRERNPNSIIMAGNVVTPDMVYQLIEKGADIVKIGIGPGSVCTTRKVTGVGYPQFSAIVECADAAHGSGGHICADGGIREIGDFAKGFGAGADFIMAGGIFAGTDEVGTELYGSASNYALGTLYGGKKEYRAAEGKLVQVEQKGSIKNLVEEILGGLRSAGSYIGAKNIKDFPKCATFIKVNRRYNDLYGD